ncbi:MAG: hypothetical protein ACP5G7_02280 [Anaerolineae bacterium]
MTPSEESIVTVCVSQGLLRAQAIAAKLESLGIPAACKYESIGRVIGITADGLGQVEVQVPAEWRERALAALQEMPLPKDVDLEPSPDERGNGSS